MDRILFPVKDDDEKLILIFFWSGVGMAGASQWPSERHLPKIFREIKLPRE